MARSSRWSLLRGKRAAAGAQPLVHVLAVVMPPAPAAENLGVGLRRPCREQVFGGLLGAITRTAPARPATLPSDSTAKLSLIASPFFKL